MADEGRHSDRWIGLLGRALQVGMLIGLLLGLCPALILEGFMIGRSPVLAMSTSTLQRRGNVSEPTTVARTRRPAVIPIVSCATARSNCALILYLHVMW